MTEQDYKKGIKKANELLKVLKRKWDSKQYENAGALEEFKLRDYISKLQLNYQEERRILDYFEQEAFKISGY